MNKYFVSGLLSIATLAGVITPVAAKTVPASSAGLTHRVAPPTTGKSATKGAQMKEKKMEKKEKRIERKLERKAERKADRRADKKAR